MDLFVVIVLCAVGIVLLLLEIFLIPGTTIAGVAGVLFSGGAIYYAYSHLGVLEGSITLLISLIVFGAAIVYMVRSKALDGIELKTDIRSTVASDDVRKIKEGDLGITLSRLNTMGKVMVNDVIMEAKTIGEFIDEGMQIVVVEVWPTQLIVKLKK